MESRLYLIENELSDWEAREQKFKKLFGNSVVDSKAFLKEKLAFYEVLESKYVGSRQFDQLGAKIIRQEKRKLEQKVFPNLIVRMVHRLVSNLLAKQQVARFGASQAGNLKLLQGKVLASGFNGLENLIAQKSEQGLKEFSIPMSEYISEHYKMDYDLKFSKGSDGNYQFEGYQAKLTDLNLKEVKTCLIEPSSLKPDHAYNLLCGRPVLKNTSGQSQWMQIDLNDKDDKGNLKIRGISKETGFDLAASLEKLPLKNADEIKNSLLEQLKNGQQVVAVLEVKGKENTCNLIAYPLRHEIGIFNAKMDRLSPVDLKPQQRPEAVQIKQIEKVNRKQMKVAR